MNQDGIVCTKTNSKSRIELFFNLNYILLNFNFIQVLILWRDLIY